MYVVYLLLQEFHLKDSDNTDKPVKSGALSSQQYEQNHSTNDKKDSQNLNEVQPLLFSNNTEAKLDESNHVSNNVSKTSAEFLNKIDANMKSNTFDNLVNHVAKSNGGVEESTGEIEFDILLEKFNSYFLIT